MPGERRSAMNGCRIRASGSGRPGRTGSSTTATISSRIIDEEPFDPGPERLPRRGCLDLELADRLAEGGFGREIGGVPEQRQIVLLALVGVAERLEGLLDAAEDGVALGFGNEAVERERSVPVGRERGLIALPDLVLRGRPLHRQELV